MAKTELDPLLHSELRLKIMSLLMGADWVSFGFLKDETGATPGNLSVQLKKLEKADYLKIEKSFRNNYPLTTCRVTGKGKKAFADYAGRISEYLFPPSKDGR